MTDPIADYLTRLRNAIMAHHRVVEVPASNLKKQNAIRVLKRVSTPGLRKYTGYKDMPRVINGLGIAILSTSKGVMTDKEAAQLKIGGEVLCFVY